MKFTFLTLALLAGSSLVQADLASSISTLKNVGPEGKGNAAATAAWQEVAAAKADDLTLLLTGMNGANPLAENWLRAAISAVADRAIAGKAIPTTALIAFLQDTHNSPQPRALAFDLIQAVAPDEATRLTPSLLEDPSPELRRHPVARLIEEGDAALAKDDKPAATAAYQRGLSSARDEDQIKPLAKALRSLGQKVDLPQHFGFLMQWKLIAPFTNSERKGYDTVFPPEQSLDFTKGYEGKGKSAAWIDFTSTDEYGKIDFNKPFGMEKEVTGYAATEFVSEEARAVELRLGGKNGTKIWLNGEQVFARDEYHRGAKLDQYKIPVQLKAGKNTILVKCCQNEQKEAWTVEWEFQLRVCDSTGTAIASAKL